LFFYTWVQTVFFKKKKNNQLQKIINAIFYLSKNTFIFFD